MAQRNEKVCTMAQDGMLWLDERRFFGKPSQPNILARRVGEREHSRGEPDASLNPAMVARRTAWQ